MKIGVTGGTGVIGEGVIPELLARGHEVVTGAASGCDAILHIGEGAQFMIAEAKRAKVRRFVLVSSEDIHMPPDLDWTIIRPSHVYGPGDEVISKLLKMVRALPAVPVLDDEEFQPIWHEDLAKVLAAAVERTDLDSQTLDAIGPEITTMNDLLARFAKITGRAPVRVPVPMALLQPVRIHARGRNAIELLGINTTPLDEGLRILADSMPEVLPEEGVGKLEHKRFFADIRGSKYSAPALMMQFRQRVNDFMPLEFQAEPGAPGQIEKGTTLTGHLPLRGNFQVRAEVVEPGHVVVATIEGHPLAGIVEFTTSEENGAVRFAIDTWTRASNLFDLIVTRTLGSLAQSANWRAVVQRAIDASGGTSDGVHEEAEKLSDDEAKAVEERVKSMVQSRKREEAAESTAPKHAP